MLLCNKNGKDIANHKEDARNRISFWWRKSIGEHNKVDDHCSNHRSHHASTNEKGVPIFKRSTWLEFEYEVVVDPCYLPPKQNATIGEHVQASQCKHTADSFAEHWSV